MFVWNATLLTGKRILSKVAWNDKARIQHMAPLSAAKGIIEPGDVILTLDGIDVANDGKIPFRPGERVSLTSYLQTKFAGDHVFLNSFRNGQEIEVQAPVSILKDLVPSQCGRTGMYGPVMSLPRGREGL